jgi:soluble lytic murein transglycosylase-like protein
MKRKNDRRVAAAGAVATMAAAGAVGIVALVPAVAAEAGPDKQSSTPPKMAKHDPQKHAGKAGLQSFVPKQYRKTIEKAAGHYHVDHRMLAAQIETESHFDPHAASGAGAKGIAQFTDATADKYGLRNPYNAKQSINAEAKMMHDLIGQFGSTRLALAAYNAGPGAVQAAHGVPPIAETQGYVAKIEALMDEGHRSGHGKHHKAKAHKAHGGHSSHHSKSHHSKSHKSH